MNNQQAYDVWSESYDAARNKTRDLEAAALRQTIVIAEPLEILEIGCGTGKNTEWLAPKSKRLIGADFSAEMLARAREKIAARNVEFKRMDLREQWRFAADEFDLITCSLALEHIENINFVFAEARRVLRANGRFYVGELHPFKQYAGSKARFEINSGVFELECFVHHVSDFFAAGKAHGFKIAELNEWFDEKSGGENQIPRVLTIVFQLEK